MSYFTENEAMKLIGKRVRVKPEGCSTDLPRDTCGTVISKEIRIDGFAICVKWANYPLLRIETSTYSKEGFQKCVKLLD